MTRAAWAASTRSWSAMAMTSRRVALQHDGKDLLDPTHAVRREGVDVQVRATVGLLGVGAVRGAQEGGAHDAATGPGSRGAASRGRGPTLSQIG